MEPVEPTAWLNPRNAWNPWNPMRLTGSTGSRNSLGSRNAKVPGQRVPQVPPVPPPSVPDFRGREMLHQVQAQRLKPNCMAVGNKFERSGTCLGNLSPRRSLRSVGPWPSSSASGRQLGHQESSPHALRLERKPAQPTWFHHAPHMVSFHVLSYSFIFL